MSRHDVCITVTLQTNSTYNWSLQCETERLTDSATHRQTDRERVLPTERLTYSGTHRQTDRETECYPQRDWTVSSQLTRDESKSTVQRGTTGDQPTSSCLSPTTNTTPSASAENQIPECGLIPYMAQLGSVLARTSSNFYRATQLC